MLFRVLIVGIAILVAIPETWVAPAITAEIDHRGFCERNAQTCGAPREILRELSRKIRMLITQLHEADGNARPAVFATPETSQPALPALRLTQPATDPFGTVAQQTLTSEDRSTPWRPPPPETSR